MWSPVPVVTDFAVVQQDGVVPGKAAAAMAKQKRNLHLRPIATHTHHVFEPFVLEAHGFEDNSVFRFVTHVAACRPRYVQRELLNEIRCTVSVELARARIQAVTATQRAGNFETDEADANDQDLHAGDIAA